MNRGPWEGSKDQSALSADLDTEDSDSVLTKTTCALFQALQVSFNGRLLVPSAATLCTTPALLRPPVFTLLPQAPKRVFKANPEHAADTLRVTRVQHS